MKRNARYQYRYTGPKRRGGGGPWKGLLGVLLAVLLLAALTLLAGQRYILYTDDGVRLALPFFRGRTEEPESDVSAEVKFAEQTRPALPEPEDGAVPLRAVPVTPEQLGRRGAAAVTAAGGNAGVLTVKGEDGRLSFESGQSLAPEEEPEWEAGAAAEKLHAAGLFAVARVSCFRDDALGAQTEHALRADDGGRWNYDAAGLFWTDPADPEVRAYLTGLLRELAALGFDEVLLDHCGWPTEGRLDRLDRREDELDAVSVFLREANEALEGTGCVLSVLTGPAALAGEDPVSGLGPELLAGLSGRVWLTAEDGAATEDAGAAVRPVREFSDALRGEYLR